MGTARNHCLTKKRKAIMALIAENGPMTVEQLAQTLGGTDRCMRRTMCDMRKAGQVRKVGFGMSSAGAPQMIYDLDGGYTPPPPRPDSFSIRRAEVLAALRQHKKLTQPQCASLLGYRVEELRRVFDALHAQRSIYISDWKRSYGTGGGMARIFSLGAKPDAPRPKHDVRADNRRCKQRQRALQKPKHAPRTLNPWANLLVGAQ
jgi:predicted ArsR family transcriptional regulator